VLLPLQEDDFEPPPPVLFEEVDQTVIEVAAIEDDEVNQMQETGIAYQTEWPAGVNEECQTDKSGPLLERLISIQRFVSDFQL
jgi:hypothetical protein